MELTELLKATRADIAALFGIDINECSFLEDKLVERAGIDVKDPRSMSRCFTDDINFTLWRTDLSDADATKLLDHFNTFEAGCAQLTKKTGVREDFPQPRTIIRWADDRPTGPIPYHQFEIKAKVFAEKILPDFMTSIAQKEKNNFWTYMLASANSTLRMFDQPRNNMADLERRLEAAFGRGYH